MEFKKIGQLMDFFSSSESYDDDDIDDDDKHDLGFDGFSSEFFQIIQYIQGENLIPQNYFSNELD